MQTALQKEEEIGFVIYVVDDEVMQRKMLQDMLNSIDLPTSVLVYEDAQSAFEEASKNPPDLIVTDYRMPGVDGIQFTKNLRSQPSTRNVKVIMVTVSDDEEVRIRALDNGVNDYLTKPLRKKEVQLRATNILRSHRDELINKDRDQMFQDILMNGQGCPDYEDEAYQLLCTLVNQHTRNDPAHIIRVSQLAKVLARLTQQPQEFVNDIARAAPLYDIGVLLLQDKLERKEYKTIYNQHTQTSGVLLKDMTSPVYKLANEIAQYHHHHYDGTNKELKGDDIPISARIMSVIDHLEHYMYSGLDVSDALAKIDSLSNTVLDPKIVTQLKTNQVGIEKIYSSSPPNTEHHSVCITLTH